LAVILHIVMDQFFRTGTEIVLREVFRGEVYSAKPMIVVKDAPDLLALYIPPGTPWKQPTTLDGGRVTPTAVANGSWKLSDAVWRGPHGSLRLVIPGADYSVIPSWGQTRTLSHWYINLEEPLRRTSLGFDFLDQILDIIVSPDLSVWRWKDQDELEEAAIVGLVNDEELRVINANGLKAIEFFVSGGSPFIGWEHWQPVPQWSIPTLRANWDIVS